MIDRPQGFQIQGDNFFLNVFLYLTILAEGLGNGKACITIPDSLNGNARALLSLPGQ